MGKKNKPNRSKPYENKIAERRIARSHVNPRPNPGEGANAAEEAGRPDASQQGSEARSPENVDQDNPDAQGADRAGAEPTERPNVH